MYARVIIIQIITEHTCVCKSHFVQIITEHTCVEEPFCTDPTRVNTCVRAVLYRAHPAHMCQRFRSYRSHPDKHELEHSDPIDPSRSMCVTEPSCADLIYVVNV